MKDAITADCLYCGSTAIYLTTMFRLDWFRCNNCDGEFNCLTEIEPDTSGIIIEGDTE